MRQRPEEEFILVRYYLNHDMDRWKFILRYRLGRSVDTFEPFMLLTRVPTGSAALFWDSVRDANAIYSANSSTCSPCFVTHKLAVLAFIVVICLSPAGHGDLLACQAVGIQATYAKILCCSPLKKYDTFHAGHQYDIHTGIPCLEEGTTGWHWCWGLPALRDEWGLCHWRCAKNPSDIFRAQWLCPHQSVEKRDG